MKIHKLQCPNCSAKLNLDSINSNHIFCLYCGQPFLIDDENQTYTININKTDHKRYTDDAEIIKAKLKDKEDKRTWLSILICFVIGLGLPLGMLIKFEIDENIARGEGKISAGFYRDLVGKDYQTVEAHFAAAGFTNIELIDLNDAGIAFWNDGKVSVISVGGYTNFDSTNWFNADTKVVISYH